MAKIQVLKVDSSIAIIFISFFLLKLTSSCATGVFDSNNKIKNGKFSSPFRGAISSSSPPNDWQSSHAALAYGTNFNSRWPAFQQAISLGDDYTNLAYNQTITLTQNSYQLSLRYAAYQFSSTNSGFMIIWNDEVVFSIDYLPNDNTRRFTGKVKAKAGANKLTLMGKNSQNSFGATIYDVTLYQILTDYFQVENEDGTCSCQPGYYSTHISPVCQPCDDQVSKCIQCSKPNADPSDPTIVCTQCSVGYFAQLSNLCSLCTNQFVGCKECQQNGNLCLVCDSNLNLEQKDGVCNCLSGHYFNETIGMCLPCHLLDSLCEECKGDDIQVGVPGAGIFECFKCQSGYFANETSCFTCHSALFGCLTCEQDGLECLTCDIANNFNLSDLNTCECKTGFYFNTTSSQCEVCSGLDSLCLQCSQQFLAAITSYTYICQTCQDGNYANGSSCFACIDYLAGCLSCEQDGSKCITCDIMSNFTLNSEQVCICIPGFHFNSSWMGCDMCVQLHQFCLQCTQAINNGNFVYSCTECFVGFFPLQSSCLPCSNQIPGCLECSQNLTTLECFSCDQSIFYFLDTNQNISIYATCKLCQLDGCLNCTSLTICVSCDEANNYFMIDNASILCTKCGIEGCVTCSSLEECSICNEMNNYFLNYTSLQCIKCQLEGCVDCSNYSICSKCSLIKGYYEQPDESGHCQKHPQISGCGGYMFENIDQQTDKSSLLIPTYTQDECSRMPIIQTLTTGVEYGSYILLCFSIVCAKIVGIELFGVLQLAFLNLADNPTVNLYLSPLLSWKSINGLNLPTSKTLDNGIKWLTGNDQIVPRSVAAIGYSHSFLSNVNVMLLILVGELFIFVALRIITRKIGCLQVLANFLLNQLFIATLIFNTFNIAFSAGLHLRYSSYDNTPNYALSNCAMYFTFLLYLICLFYIETAGNSKFGEFKDKMKGGFVNKFYITASVIYRMILGFYMAYGNEDQYQSLIVLAISFTYLAYTFTNLPFKDTYQNYRAMACHLIQLSILFITNYYTSLTKNQTIQIKLRNYDAAIFQICAIVFCVLLSAVALVYEVLIYLKKNVWQKYKNQRIGNDNEKVSSHQASNYNLNQFGYDNVEQISLQQ